MTVAELIEKLKTMPSDYEVTHWNQLYMRAPDAEQLSAVVISGDEGTCGKSALEIYDYYALVAYEVSHETRALWASYKEQS